MNCRPGDLAIVVRSTDASSLLSFGPCTQGSIGTPVTVDHVRHDCFSRPWWVLRKAIKCPVCGGRVIAYLEADLQPIRPPATPVERSTPVEAEVVAA